MKEREKKSERAYHFEERMLIVEKDEANDKGEFGTNTATGEEREVGVVSLEELVTTSKRVLSLVVTSNTEKEEELERKRENEREIW